MKTGPTFAVSSMLGVTTMTSMSVFTVAVFAPEAAREIGVDPTYIGVFTAVVYMAAMGSGLATSSFIARYGAIRVCQATMLLSAAGMAAITLASPWAAVVCALLLGLGYGPINPASAHVLMKVTSPKWRPLIFSIKQTGVTLGGLAAGVIVPLLVISIGWKGAAFFVGAVSLAIMAAIQPIRQAVDADRRADERLAFGLAASLGLILDHAQLRKLAVTGFAFAGCQVSVGAFFVVYLTESLAMPLVQAGLIFATVQGGGIFGRIFWGMVSDRAISSRWVLAGLGILIALSVSGLNMMNEDWPFIALAALGATVGLCSFGWNGVYLSEVARLAPDGKAGEATGSVQFIMYGGVVFVPPAFGAIVALMHSYTVAFLLVAALAGAAGLYMMHGQSSKNLAQPD